MNVDIPVNYDSPGALRELLDSLGFNTLKRWGQNFLISPSARARIVGALELAPGAPVWEIGPGLGSLTHALLAAGHPLTVFEIDPGYVAFLNRTWGPASPAPLPGFRTVAGDVLDTWAPEAQVLAAAGLPRPAVVGNLPYNAASAILAAFCDAGWRPPVSVFMVQKEMAQRMGAALGSKNYSAFSVAVQTHFRVKSLFSLSGGNFFPPPEVDSTVVRLEPLPGPGPRDPARYAALVRGAFSSRRKTLRNNLAGSVTHPALRPYGEERLSAAFTAAGVDLSRRAETLSPADWLRVEAALDG